MVRTLGTDSTLKGGEGPDLLSTDRGVTLRAGDWETGGMCLSP